MRRYLINMVKIAYKSILLFLLFIILIPPGVVSAQTPSPSRPVYIVKEGDTLWDIAYRFHISQAELANANGILDTNQISIGMALAIPGIEGIEGILTTQAVPYGETLHSLSLRYGLSVQELMRLNHITSPNELYVGYSLIVPEEGPPHPPGKRITLRIGQSLLELAILNKTDTWRLLAANQLSNGSVVMPGEVLNLPGSDDSGPGGLPGEISSIDFPRLTQGQTADIQVDTTGDISLSGSLMDHRLNFFPTSNNRIIALQGVYAMQEPGLYPLAIQGSTPEGLLFNFSQMVMVHAGDFLYDRSLAVDPATLDPETNQAENELWYSSATTASPEKQWDGTLFLPVDPVFADCYSSRFGSRRSYNGSGYIYFHTGLDFCGQVGDPVYAAASGTVILTGTLTVRGNATIIDHGWGVYSAYMHQSEILVHEGDHVERGQLIGRVGNTGRVEGPHLHFEILVGGVQVDPLAWLNQEFPQDIIPSGGD